MCQCYTINGSGDDRLRNDDATSIASYHIIAISPIGFRHYNLFYIYRAVPFLTLWLPSLSRSGLFENTLALDILECFIYLVAPPDDQFCSSLAML